jgi:hypothetical protein
MAIPVRPRIGEVGIHAPLGVLSKTLPSRSITAMCVVSLTTPAVRSSSRAGCGSWVASGRLAVQ